MVCEYKKCDINCVILQIKFLNPMISRRPRLQRQRKIFKQQGKNVPRPTQLNINVATWGRLLKRSNIPPHPPQPSTPPIANTSSSQQHPQQPSHHHHQQQQNWQSNLLNNNQSQGNKHFQHLMYIFTKKADSCATQKQQMSSQIPVMDILDWFFKFRHRDPQN